jgi:MtN3 and saliva related transmembrane protein
MSWQQWIGLSAGTLTTISFVPQLLRVWRRKSASDLSSGMFIVFCVGVVLWLVYGLVIHDLAVIVANSATLTLALGILVLKYKFDKSIK